MLRVIILITMLLVSSSYGCATSPSTGEPGILYGMSKGDVVAKLNAKSNEIVSVSDNKVIAVGNWELTNQIRKKIFYFDNNQLVRVWYGPVDED